MKRLLVRLSLALLLVAGILLPRTAGANCEYPHWETITYYAFVFPSNPDPPSCTGCNVGSPVCNAFVWQEIGGITIDCDETVTTWGDTTSCTDEINTTRYSGSCPPLCN